MTRYFDLQIFADDGFSIPGIDEDIVKELAEALPSEQDASAEPEVTAETDDTEQEGDASEPTADADSDNKPVETEADAGSHEEGDNKDHKGPIPFARFAEVNNERNEYKQRIAELEAKLASNTVATPAPQQKATEAKSDAGADVQQPLDGTLSQEQMQKVIKIAVATAKEKLNLTDEDLENMTFADGMERKAQFDTIVQQEVTKIQTDIKEYAAGQRSLQQRVAAFKQETDDVARQFDEYNTKFTAYEDSEARWSYISQKKFAEIPQLRQRVVNDAFLRIKSHKGTYQDFYVVESYFNEANAEYEQSLTPQNVAAKDTKNKVEETKNKITKAQALPKAVDVTGGGEGEKLFTPEKIAQILNGPSDEWDKLPEDVKQKILRGSL